MYNGRREFRPGRGMLLMVVGSTALFALVTFGLYAVRGWASVTIAMASITVIIGFGAIAETLVVRIELTDDALIVTELRGRRSYDIATIERIEESKGGPPAIKLKDGRWVKLPAVGSSLGNSVRAWLNQ